LSDASTMKRKAATKSKDGAATAKAQAQRNPG
jgi:hypothetical protein